MTRALYRWLNCVVRTHLWRLLVVVLSILPHLTPTLLAPPPTHHYKLLVFLKWGKLYSISALWKRSSLTQAKPGNWGKLHIGWKSIYALEYNSRFICWSVACVQSVNDKIQLTSHWSFLYIGASLGAWSVNNGQAVAWHVLQYLNSE